MKSFLPNFTVATLSDEPTKLRSKTGGVPWGIPAELWPRCCDAPQKLFAQLIHASPALDLGGEYVLFLFQCLECCGLDDDGCAAVIVSRDDLQDGPVTVANYDKQPELGERLIGEMFIDSWESVDDGIPDARYPEFFKEAQLWAIQDEFDEIEWFDQKSRFGGVPRWTGNGPQNPPSKPFEFLLQLGTWLDIPGAPPPPDRIGCQVRIEGSSHEAPFQPRTKQNAPWAVCYRPQLGDYTVEYTNLGSDGTAYVFIDRSSSPPVAVWYWNR